MHNFTFSIPQNISFGEGSLSQLSTLLKQKQLERILLISDRSLEQLGVVDKIKTIVQEAGVDVLPFVDVEPNPSVATVEKARDAYLAFDASGIIALGGGSPMDVAKAASILVSYGGSIVQYEGRAQIPGPLVPVIAIPTTAGTGSEATAAAVISDPVRNYKFSVVSREILPCHVILDPELLYSLPASVAAATGIDALIHAMEAYLSLEATPFSDAMAKQAMALIGANIRRFVADRQDKEAAGAMMVGSNFAGLAFSSARLGNVHALSHPVSAHFHVAHGVANAILLPYVLEYNAPADRGRYQEIYQYIHCGETSKFDAALLIDEVRHLLKELKMPEKLSDVGVTEDKIPLMAEDVMKSGATTSNPRHTTLEDVLQLYQEAL
ncbi:iron-containing alcohol dehydrogenase [Pseudoflavonifractor sp.]|jgi:alcohol dehydrogenase|uniref:iron-containing alcohol dehydrogenase n=1 Tax=Pseudoflavonifractor sp. TaxID=1980281 RepID=UPI003D8E9BEB